MNIKYEKHPLFEGITLVFLNDSLMGDTANKIWHPTSEFDDLTYYEQDGIIEQIIEDGEL